MQSGLIVFTLGYIMGSIPYAIIFFGDHVIKHGSKNIGATNTYRSHGPSAGIIILLLDALKGFLPTELACYMGNDIGAFAMLGAVIGHTLSMWLSFKGGKGIATYLGSILAISYELFIMTAIVWIISFVLSRFVVSVASITMCCCIPLISITIFMDAAISGVFLLVSGICVLKHKANIVKILQGTEGSIRKSKAPK